ncbi:hypothetical protein Tco_0864154, partial [Tanacetum coccineum]
EELPLDATGFMITSTQQEINEQWGLYDGFDVKLEKFLRTHIQEFVDGPLAHVLNMSMVLGEQLGRGHPDWPYVIHGHYADAGDSAAILSGALNRKEAKEPSLNAAELVIISPGIDFSKVIHEANEPDGDLALTNTEGSFPKAVQPRVVTKVFQILDVVFDGAFRGVRDEEVVVGEGVVVISSSLDMLTNNCLGGIMVSLIFLEGLDEEALVEFMVE